MTGCLEQTTVARLLDRTLTPAESTRVVEHIDVCEDCRRLVSALAPGQPSDSLPALGSGVLPAELTSFARGFAPVPGPPHALDLGSDDDELAVVGRYRLTRCLGRGATGAVYAAHDPELGREIAIKVLRLGHVVTADARARLLREAQALARVSHPNVVAIYDVGTAGDRLFIAMELVGSGTLRDWLATPRSIDEIVRLVIGAALGLAAAHGCGLVHRDVKPDNILVDPSGRVRIGDFGLVLSTGDLVAAGDRDPAIGSAPRPPSLTLTGTLVGTPAYMAPRPR